MSKIATIGFFDGVHRGHRFLFAQLQEQARQHDLSPVIYTFKQHPKLILTGQSPAMLTTMDERLGLLETFAQVSALDFASETAQAVRDTATLSGPRSVVVGGVAFAISIPSLLPLLSPSVMFDHTLSALMK